MGKKTSLYSGGNNPTVTPLFSLHRAVLLLSGAVLLLVAAVLPRPPAVLPHWRRYYRKHLTTSTFDEMTNSKERKGPGVQR